MTVTEARDNRIGRAADSLRNAANRLIESLDNSGLMSRSALALREAVYAYDDAMSDPQHEEDDPVAADIYSQLMAGRITGYEESQVCGACSGTGESRSGGSTCPRCKGEGVLSQF